MDEMTRTIARYAASLAFERLPAEAVRAAKRHLVDTIACALGGANCEPALMGLRLAAGAVPALRAGRIIVHGTRTTPEAAAFVTTTMIRYLDYNDVVNGGHPSDALGAVLALADAAGADGRRLLSGMIIAYEIVTRLIATMRMRERGWDQGFAIGIGAVAGAGHVLRLSAEELGQAVAITAVANVPLRATRAGQLSKWKGAATAFAARNAVFAAELAGEGMTGPEAAFSGRHGVFAQLSGEFVLPPFDEEFRLTGVGLKYWPVENNAQAAVWAAIQLRERLPVERIAGIDIVTARTGWHELGSEPQKWDPQTRETADHSLPYIFARALVDGGLSVASFDRDAYLDPGLRPLMAKIRVHPDESIDKLFPETVVMRIRANDVDGNDHAIEIENPRGHRRNPMDDGEISAKFMAQAEPALGKKAAAALECLWTIEREATLGRFYDLIDRV